MITCKWSVEKVKVTGDNNLVTDVYWRCEATDGDLVASYSGDSKLTAGDTFTAYDQLTEQQVLDWCVPAVKDRVESQLTVSIENQVAQKAAELALPWAVVAPTE